MSWINPRKFLNKSRLYGNNLNIDCGQQFDESFEDVCTMEASRYRKEEFSGNDNELFEMTLIDEIELKNYDIKNTRKRW